MISISLSMFTNSDLLLGNRKVFFLVLIFWNFCFIFYSILYIFFVDSCPFCNFKYSQSLYHFSKYFNLNSIEYFLNFIYVKIIWVIYYYNCNEFIRNYYLKFIIYLKQENNLKNKINNFIFWIFKQKYYLL
jgi:hypothetical protein